MFVILYTTHFNLLIMWDKIILITGGILGGLAVILGAFGAHGLKPKLSPDTLDAFETGVRYQIYHALALLFVGLLYDRFMSGTFLASALCFFLGILLFSGSLYVITRFALMESVLPSWVGPLTPIGGSLLILGWILIVIGVFQNFKI